MNCATSCINVAVGVHDCFTNRHLVTSKLGQNIYDSRMSLIKGVIRPEQLELFALELESSLE